jgi:hypothetical protein
MDYFNLSNLFGNSKVERLKKGIKDIDENESLSNLSEDGVFVQSIIQIIYDNSNLNKNDLQEKLESQQLDNVKKQLDNFEFLLQAVNELNTNDDDDDFSMQSIDKTKLQKQIKIYQDYIATVNRIEDHQVGGKYKTIKRKFKRKTLKKSCKKSPKKSKQRRTRK